MFESSNCAYQTLGTENTDQLTNHSRFAVSASEAFLPRVPTNDRFVKKNVADLGFDTRRLSNSF
jgi:hypothetical protein